jgi:hypothetical protein
MITAENGIEILTTALATCSPTAQRLRVLAVETLCLLSNRGHTTYIPVTLGTTALRLIEDFWRRVEYWPPPGVGADIKLLLSLTLCLFQN